MLAFDPGKKPKRIDTMIRDSVLRRRFIKGSGALTGRGQPTMTIMALAFRAAEHIAAAARANEI